MTVEVLVLGGGIAGMTAAHELAERGFAVTIVERRGAVGGLASSARDAMGRPSEHSWRGFAPFYENAFDVMKRVPVGAGRSAYDELTRPIHFHLPKEAAGSDSADVPLTLADRAVLGSAVLRSMASCHARREAEHTRISWEKLVAARLSEHARDQVVRMIGPGLGLDLHLGSQHHVARFVELNLQPLPPRIHRDAEGTFETRNGGRWQVTRRPTSEAWLDPWARHLATLGVKFRMETDVRALIAREEAGAPSIVGVEVFDRRRGDVLTLSADAVVCALAPSALAAVIKGSSTALRRHAALSRFEALGEQGVHHQISAHLFFARSFRLPHARSVIALPDSPWLLTLVPCERLWDPGVALGEGVGGVWSVTICQSDTPGRQLGKPAIACRPEEALAEVVDQIRRSESLAELLATHNDGQRFDDNPLVHTALWKHWHWDEALGRLATDEPKWGNTLKSQPLRPTTASDAFPNLAFAGAHVRTTVDFFSMEGAVESGKLAAEHLRATLAPSTARVLVHAHGAPRWFAPLRRLDEARYVGDRAAWSDSPHCATPSPIRAPAHACLVLGGGSASAIAQVGALRALEEAGVRFAAVGGVSMGAIFAACVARGWSADEIRERAREAFRGPGAMLDPTLPRVSLLAGKRFERSLVRLFGDARIEDLAIPFTCVSTDLARAELVVHDHGRLTDALRASCAIPGILPPVYRDGVLLIDGGALDNLPVETMRARHPSGWIVGVEVDDTPRLERAPGILELLTRASRVATRARSRRLAASGAMDLHVRLPVADVGLLAFGRHDELCRRGYDLARKALASAELGSGPHRVATAERCAVATLDAAAASLAAPGAR